MTQFTRRVQSLVFLTVAAVILGWLAACLPFGRWNGFTARAETEPAVALSAKPVRIAGWSLERVSADDWERPKTIETVATVVQRFDVMVLRNVQSRQADLMPRLLTAVNTQNQRYDFVISTSSDDSGDKAGTQLAILFNVQLLAIDRSSLRMLRHLRRDRQQTAQEMNPDTATAAAVPMVAASSSGSDAGSTPSTESVGLVARLRSRQKSPGSENPFSFIVLATDSTVQQITNSTGLIEPYRTAVHGCQDDDVLLVCDADMTTTASAAVQAVAAGKSAIGGFSPVPGLRPETAPAPRTAFLFGLPGVAEFTGQSGLFDVKRELGLQITDGSNALDQSPAWAEFEPRESVPTRIADAASDGRLR